MKITESQLRRLIRQEVGRLVEMPARPRAGVYTDPDTMPRGPKVGRAQKIADAPGTFAYQQLMQYAPDKLEQLEAEAPKAYKDFLVSLYDMSDPDSGAGGLDGRGFMPHLDRALTAAGLGASDAGGIEMQELAGDAVTRLRSGMREMAEEVFELMVGGLEERGVDPYEGLPTLIRHVRAAEGLSGIADMLEELARNQGY